MLKVEIADTPSKLEHGLMFVTELPADEGMLFVFPRPTKLAFWGRNTFIPLDIAFIDRNNRIESINKIKPFCLDKVASTGDCVMAIEANAGYFTDNSIQVGDFIEISSDDWQRKAEIEFRREGEKREKQNIKESQAIAPPTVAPQGVDSPVQPTDEQDESHLPVLSPEDLKDILEDSFDEPEGPPEQEQLPEEQPEEQPEEPTEEEQPSPEPRKEYPAFSNVFDALDWAEKNREVVRIDYTTRSGRHLIRDVEPHGQFHADTTMHQILVCFDETVNDIRAFILTNIHSWSFLGKEFTKKFVVRA